MGKYSLDRDYQATLVSVQRTNTSPGITSGIKTYP